MLIHLQTTQFQDNLVRAQYFLFYCCDIYFCSTYSCSYFFLGRDPALLLWKTRTGKFIKRLGSGFFQKGICATCFSHDNRYICAIDCDDHHSLGIWDIESEELIIQSNACHGIPPQVTSLLWSPDFFPVPELNNKLVDLFITAGDISSYINHIITLIIKIIIVTIIGERHIRFWYYQRPNDSHDGSLTYKVGNMAQIRNVLLFYFFISLS